MRIERVELSGVGPFEDAVLEIPEPTGNGELVLFEGPNGSGKSTLAAFLALSALGNWLSGAMLLGRSQEPTPIQIPPTWARADLGAFKSRVRAWPASAACQIADGESAALFSLGPGIQLVRGAAATATVFHKIDTLKQAAVGQTFSWAAFAFRAHQESAGLRTDGPRDISEHPIEGALSFGHGGAGASKYLGQLLTNIEYERVRALLYAQQSANSDMSAKAKSLEENQHRLAEALSRVLDRQVTLEFPFGTNAPKIRFDGEEIPIDYLGEGLRSTMAWLSDLLVRLLRMPWTDTTRSPFDQEFWLILDEVDEGLHPTLQARLFPSLRSLFPNARIYATTHSPFVVASVGEGYVFPLRPDKQGRVRGPVEPRKLTPGQSLEWVISEIFEARTGFVDDPTREDLSGHKRDIRQFQKTGTMDWPAFLSRRARLLGLNDEVRTVVFMQESPIAADIRREVERAAPSTDVSAS